MTAKGSFVRFARHVTDWALPYSFNRMGFELNRRGFLPDDLPDDCHGRVALVTGANSGIGLAASRELVRRRFDVWMLCRDAARGTAARDGLAREYGEQRVHLAIVDMSSNASVRAFVRGFSADRVDVLVHNAGVLPHERILTSDGVELTFATSVVGPFALTTLLLGPLSRSIDARVIFVASGGLYAQRLDVALATKDQGPFDGLVAYANAKRAQVILAHMFADKLSGRAPITFASMHPGWADTNAVKTSLPKFHDTMQKLLRSPEQGADTIVWLAASPTPRGTRGELWFDRRVVAEHPLPWTHEGKAARDQLFALAERLGEVKVALPDVRAERMA